MDIIRLAVKPLSCPQGLTNLEFEQIVQGIMQAFGNEGRDLKDRETKRDALQRFRVDAEEYGFVKLGFQPVCCGGCVGSFIAMWQMLLVRRERQLLAA